MLIEEFNKRVADINSYYDVLSFIDKIDSYKKGSHVMNLYNNSELTVDSEMQKCMRANALLMLYNLVESTFRNCIFLIYDAIHDHSLTYGELSDYLRRVWLELEFKDGMSVDNIRKRAKEISDTVVDNKVMYDAIPKGTSGNLDLTIMIRISRKFGINFGRITNKGKVEHSLEFIKMHRNNLAHGNRTFSAIGSLVTLSELYEYKVCIVNFLRHVINIYQAYVATNQYKKVAI